MHTKTDQPTLGVDQSGGGSLHEGGRLPVTVGVNSQMTLAVAGGG